MSKLTGILTSINNDMIKFYAPLYNNQPLLWLQSIFSRDRYQEVLQQSAKLVASILFFIKKTLDFLQEEEKTSWSFSSWMPNFFQKNLLTLFYCFTLGAGCLFLILLSKCLLMISTVLYYSCLGGLSFFLFSIVSAAAIELYNFFVGSFYLQRDFDADFVPIQDQALAYEKALTDLEESLGNLETADALLEVHATLEKTRLLYTNLEATLDSINQVIPTSIFNQLRTVLNQDCSNIERKIQTKASLILAQETRIQSFDRYSFGSIERFHAYTQKIRLIAALAQQEAPPAFKVHCFKDFFFSLLLTYKEQVLLSARPSSTPVRFLSVHRSAAISAALSLLEQEALSEGSTPETQENNLALVKEILNGRVNEDTVIPNDYFNGIFLEKLNELSVLLKSDPLILSSPLSNNINLKDIHRNRFSDDSVNDRNPEHFIPVNHLTAGTTTPN